MTNANIIEAAIDYAYRGWRVVPTGGPDLKNPGACLGADWQKYATADIEAAPRLWNGKPSGVGVLLGEASNIIDLEVDAPEGEQTYLDLFGGETPVCPTFSSTRGKHRLFRWHPGLPAIAKIEHAGLEVRIGANTAQSVFPPTGVRKWLVSPDDCDPPVLPDDVVAQISTWHTRGKNGKPAGNGQPFGMPEHIQDGKRNETLFKLACSLRAKGLATDEIFAAVESVNGTRCVPPLDKDELEQIVASAGGYEQGDAEVSEGVDDPHRLARQIVAQLPTLKTWRDECYLWESPVYYRLERSDLRAKATAIIKADFDRKAAQAAAMAAAEAKELAGGKDTDKKQPKPKAHKVTRGVVANAMQAIDSLTNISWRTESPSWLIRGYEFNPAECLITRSGVLHLPSLIENKPSLIDPTPDLFTTNGVSYRFDPQAKCPQWLEFLGQLWPDDDSSRDTLQEIMGYLLLPDTSQQKLFMFIGPKRSGKGTIGRVIRQVSGPENMAATSLGSLQGEFGLQALLGKTFAIIGDARLSGRSDPATVVERLLSITGEDPQPVNRKFLPQVTAQLKTRFVLISNELPKLQDASATLPSRVILLRFRESFYGREDHTLTERLLMEAPGILNWAINGWKRLQARGYFVQPDSSRELIDRMVDIASPVKAFIDECCELGDGFQVSVSDLFHHWKDWCDNKGRKPGNEQTFGRDLSAAASNVYITRPRKGEKRYRAYNGIKMAGW